MRRIDVALSFLNNLAYAHGNSALYKSGAYLGTFGNFDLGALWQAQTTGRGEIVAVRQRATDARSVGELLERPVAVRQRATDARSVGGSSSERQGSGSGSEPPTRGRWGGNSILRLGSGLSQQAPGTYTCAFMYPSPRSCILPLEGRLLLRHTHLGISRGNA